MFKTFTQHKITCQDGVFLIPWCGSAHTHVTNPSTLTDEWQVHPVHLSVSVPQPSTRSSLLATSSQEEKFPDTSSVAHQAFSKKHSISWRLPCRLSRIVVTAWRSFFLCLMVLVFFVCLFFGLSNTPPRALDRDINTRYRYIARNCCAFMVAQLEGIDKRNKDKKISRSTPSEHAKPADPVLQAPQPE